MSECNWDPSKHGGKPCPVHGAGGSGNNGGHKIRINGGKYQTKLSDDSDWEEISPEEYNDLREGGYQDFDETVDDDFGFDEDEHLDYEDLKLKARTAETDGDKEWIRTQAEMSYEAGEISQGELDDITLLLQGQELNEESSPMNEFSGPDREGPSYAQLEANNNGSGFNEHKKVSEEYFDKYFEGRDVKEVNEGGRKLKLAYNENGEHIGTYDPVKGIMYYDDKYKNDKKPSIDYDEIARRKANEEPKDEMGVYLDKQIDPKVADKIRKAGNEITNNKSGSEEESKNLDGVKYLAPEEIGIDYDNPEASIRYYEKKNNVKLYEQPNGSFKVVPNKDDRKPQTRVKPEDFEDARFYPTTSRMDGVRWVGRYHSIHDAFNGDNKDDFGDGKFKSVGDYKGASIYQLPDGYYSINPRITSMSFKTKEALQDYLDHEYDDDYRTYDFNDKGYQEFRKTKDGFDEESPDAYKRAREAAKQKQVSQSKASMTPEQRQQIRQQINKMVASLDDARSIDEAWDIEQGVIELEEMLKKFKGK